jgi:hypothetical protein
MQVVYKYQFEWGDRSTLLLPDGAQILSLDTQGDGPDNVFLWALVTPGHTPTERYFRCYHTGEFEEEDDIPLTYVGKFTKHNGTSVFHVFETCEPL